jgi:hypothetical protein
MPMTPGDISALQNGSSAPIDPALLAVVLADGPSWVVAHEDDARRLLTYGFPAIALSDGETLAEEMVRSTQTIAVLQRPGGEGAAFGLRVKQHLQALTWTGLLTRCFLPDPFFDLAIVEHETGPERFGSYILSVLSEGLREQLGPSDNSDGISDDWPDPLPFDAPTSLPSFPVEALPEATAGYVQEVARSRQVPVDLPAMQSLGTVSAAAARRFRV